MTMVTTAMSYFLLKGLCEQGYLNESFRMLRDRFDRMLAPDTNGTLWEEWWLDGTGRSGTLQKGRTRSDAQTESTFPPALFGEYLLGIRPIEPGMKRIRPDGTGNSCTVKIELDLSSLDVSDGQEILIDGQADTLETGYPTHYLLSEGRHTVKF